MALILDGTFGVAFPTGTTEQRSIAPPDGTIYLNTTTNFLQVYNNNSWFNISYLGYIGATGGATVTTVGDYKIHTFTSSSVFSVETPGLVSVPVEVLVIAGGGAGGQRHSGGGGAGGLLYDAAFPISTGTYTVTVGAGGIGPAANTSSGTTVDGTAGSNSVFGSLIAIGGGGNPGATPATASRNGGSGSGGGASGNSTPAVFGNGVTGQGNRGGTGAINVSGESTYVGGGGGGAGAQGGASSGSTPGAGGTGLRNPITGSIVGQLSGGIYYVAGGGGGGGNASANITSAAGLGGGGAGGASGSAGPGTANTGGGGGCGGFSSTSNYAGGNGGSGVVIIRYKFQ